jgi:hypothetical protein
LFCIELRLVAGFESSMRCSESAKPLVRASSWAPGGCPVANLRLQALCRQPALAAFQPAALWFCETERTILPVDFDGHIANHSGRSIGLQYKPKAKCVMTLADNKDNQDHHDPAWQYLS